MSVAIRSSLGDVIADVLQTIPAKVIALKAAASPRTVEGWKQRKSVPQGRHVVAMLSDDELCALLLEKVGQRDAAHAIKVSAARKRLRELEGEK